MAVLVSSREARSRMQFCKFANAAIEVPRTGAKIYKDALITICMIEGIVLGCHSTEHGDLIQFKDFDCDFFSRPRSRGFTWSRR